MVDRTHITLRKPDDLHLHLRDGDALAAVLPDTVARFARAIVMPNLDPPVVNVEDARAYRERIRAALPAGAGFEPLMTLYLTEQTDPAEVGRAARGGFVHAVKYYPAGATTNAARGVRELSRTRGVLAALERHGMPLLIHGEVTDADVDIFDREAVFIDRVLEPLLREFEGLRVVLEHVTTREGVDFVRGAGERVAATITAHHLLVNRNALFEGGLRPHHYCRPVLKREHHRRALVEAATGGESCFFLGTDSAPHPASAKESACGCAGVYTAHAALELYAEVFEAAGALARLDAFAGEHGAAFYGLAPNDGTLTLERESWTVPARLDYGAGSLVPFRAGERCRWRLAA